MKPFGELTPEQQNKALITALNQVLEDFIEGDMRFGETRLDDLLDKAWDEARAMQTPWFVCEYVMDKPLLVEATNRLARACAVAAMYAEPGDPEVIWGVIE